MESAENVKLTQGEDHGCTKNEVCVQNTTSSLNLGQGCIIKETPATTQEEGECGTTNEVSVQNTASSLHLEQVSNLINGEFAMKTSTQDEEHVCTPNKVVVVSTHEEEPGKLKNDVSNDLQEISGKTIDHIFLEVCASQAVAIEHIVSSSLASPSDDELPLSSLLPRGFKMKKGVKSEKNETKNRRITRSRKN